MQAFSSKTHSASVQPYTGHSGCLKVCSCDLPQILAFTEYIMHEYRYPGAAFHYAKHEELGSCQSATVTMRMSENVLYPCFWCLHQSH